MLSISSCDRGCGREQANLAAVMHANTDYMDSVRPVVTHGFNMSQRGIELVIGAVGAGSLTVSGLPNANLGPPGWYLLFIHRMSEI